MTRLRGKVQWRYVALGGALALVALLASTQVCLRTGFGYGLWLDECPDGELRQTISVSAPSLSRGAKSAVTVGATALYTTGPSDQRRQEPIASFTPTLSLVSAAGVETPLSPEKSWERAGSALRGQVLLPKVDDGDYRLRARVKSAVGEATLELPLPLYTPARVHVLTDRPLYEPGNVVRFRAVVLKASDLSPLENRPGVWRVESADGTVLLEEKAPSGPWGVLSGSFPLDKGAGSGAWRVSWASGDATGIRAFTVKPFTLPRFRVEASAAKPFYRRHERPSLKGEVRYASGAPVAGASVELEWNVSGDWPPPTSWTDGTALPKLAKADAAGAFTVELPAVPDDLKGQATLAASLSAVDASGDRVAGAAAVLLSEDAIAVSAVSELADGLVDGFNNRLYLRATTADGRVLDGVHLNVKRLWEPADKGTDAEADLDGVASLQVDPGPPVNVVIPALPFRPPPRTPPVTRSELQDSLSPEGEVTLPDRLAFDRLEAPLGGCARSVSDGQNVVQAGVVVEPSGRILGTTTPAGRLGRCVGRVLQELRVPPGRDRFFSVMWQFDDSELPGLTVEPNGLPSVPAQVQAALHDAALTARDCLPATAESGTLGLRLLWRTAAKAKALEVAWAPNRDGTRVSEATAGCLQQRLGRIELDPSLPGEEDGPSPPVAEAVGYATLSVTGAAKYESERPQPTVLTGYEFLVTARKQGELLGSTKLLMRPGGVPAIRLRASAQLLEPGQQVSVEILRGPDFTGDLPEQLFLTHGRESFEAKVDQEKRTASWKLPPALEGWAAVQWSGAQVLLFVEPRARLTVELTPEKPRYAPGQLAHLSLDTSLGGKGGPAAVGLFGVDESLAQLTPLPGADELAALRPQATGSAAFGGMDAQALALGRIRGKNAAAATMLRVSAAPPPPQLESAVSVQGSTAFDPNEALVDRFYGVLQEFYAQERTWEATAPPTEKLRPATMAGLWRKALAAVEARKESARDAWGRPLRLHRLPADLLALTEPRLVVVAGTRLPEDVENWSQWVAKEKP